MADRELILLSSDVENAHDLQTAADAVRYFVLSHSASVRSCLAKNSVEVLLEARKTAQFAAVYDAAWNPCKTDELIWEHQMQREEDVQSCSQEFNIDVIPAKEPLEIETEDQYRSRVMQAAKEFAPGSHLVIVPRCVITTVFKGWQAAVEPALVCSIWTITEKAVECTWFANTLEKLQHHLEVSVIATNVPAESAAFQPEIRPATPFPAKAESEQAQAINSTFEIHLKQLEDWKIGTEDQIHRLTSALEQKNKEVEAWKQSSAHHNYRLETLEKRMSELETIVRTLQMEISTKLQREVEEQGKRHEEHSAKIEKHWEDLDLRFQQLDMSVDELRGSFEIRLEAETKARSTEKAPVERNFPVSIQNAAIQEGKWHVSVVATQLCWGYLCLSQQGTKPTISSQPFQFTSSPLDIDLSPLFALQSDQNYQLYVLSDIQKASNDYSLQISSLHQSLPSRLRYKDTHFYQSCSNPQEIESYVRLLKGEESVQLFRQLTCEWKNPVFEQFQTFVQCFVEMQGDEKRIRKRMAEIGFRLSA